MTNLRSLVAAAGVSLVALSLLTAASSPNAAQPAPQHQRGLQLAGIFGESDEERAARLAAEQRESDQDAAIADLKTRIRDLDDTVRRLTGQNETLNHKVDQFQAKIDRMQKDFDYKLCTVTAQQVGGDTASLPCGGGAASPGFAPSSAPPPPEQPFTDTPASSRPPRSLAPPPGELGTLPRNEAPTQDSSAPPDDAAAAQDSPYRAEFDTGLNLLGKAQYDDARAAFRAYADNHPKDDLAPQAVFWVGNIAFVQKDYPNAAHAFAEEIKKYPSNSRAPESMLKLGQSLVSMGQKKEGCFTLGAISATYPKSPKATLAQAGAAQKASGCK
ncbi:MAG TPA: tol-pal system protein YbgF [Rhizomicrobium sp.]